MNFSIVTYLAGEEFKKVRGLQKELSELTGSKKCLEDWLPHITIGDGITVSAEKMSVVEEELEKFARNQEALTVSLRGFSGTGNWKGTVEGKITPYVIWLNVDVSLELMGLFNTLRDAVTAKYDTWLPRTVTYVPHITLAFADLSEEGYRKGMEYLASQNFETTFIISHVALTECYGVGNMTSVEYRKFYFSNRP